MPSSVVGLVPYQGNYRIMDKNEYSDPNLNNRFKIVRFHIVNYDHVLTLMNFATVNI